MERISLTMIKTLLFAAFYCTLLSMVPIDSKNNSISVKFKIHKNKSIDSNKTVKVDQRKHDLLGNLEDGCIEYCAFFDLQCVAVAYQRYPYACTSNKFSFLIFGSLI